MSARKPCARIRADAWQMRMKSKQVSLVRAAAHSRTMNKACFMEGTSAVSVGSDSVVPDRFGNDHRQAVGDKVFDPSLSLADTETSVQLLIVSANPPSDRGDRGDREGSDTNVPDRLPIG